MNKKRFSIFKKNIRDITRSSRSTHGLRRAARNFIKELNLYQRHLEGMHKIEMGGSIQDCSMVQVGGGKHILTGFLNIDIKPPADIVFDVREGIPLKSNTVNLIFSEHFFEHIDYPISAKKFISECYRVLENDGKVVLGVPDSQLILSAYQKRDKRFRREILKKWYSKRNCLEHFNTYIDLVNYHFRDQDDDPQYNPHYWSYDFEKLKSLLVTAGFKRVRRWEFDPKIANLKRKWGSIYVEAAKY